MAAAAIAQAQAEADAAAAAKAQAEAEAAAAAKAQSDAEAAAAIAQAQAEADAAAAAKAQAEAEAAAAAKAQSDAEAAAAIAQAQAEADAAAAAKAQAEADAAAAAKAQAEAEAAAAAKAQSDAEAAAAIAQAQAEADAAAAAKAQAQADAAAAAKAQAEAEAAAAAKAQAEAEAAAKSQAQAKAAAAADNLQADAEAADVATIQVKIEAAAAAIAQAEAGAAAADKAQSEARAAAAFKVQALNDAVAAAEEKLQAEEAMVVKTRLQVEKLKSLQTDATEAGEASAFSSLEGIKNFAAMAYGSAMEKAPQAWDAARSFTVASIKSLGENQHFVAGTLLLSTAAGAAASLLPVPVKAAYYAGAATTLAAIGSLHYENGENSVYSFVKSAGDFSHPATATVVTAATGLVSAGIGYLDGSAKYEQFVSTVAVTYQEKLQDVGKKAAQRLMEQRAEEYDKYPLLSAMRAHGVHDALQETVKSAVIGVATSATVLALSKLAHSTYAYVTGIDDLVSDIPPSDAADPYALAPVAPPEPEHLHEMPALIGTAQEQYA
ncbi:hypothetical protein [Comamonas endophytica]|uniref:Uncharacterized protein n=1 Tax=Comamonas endophytica TaxID=2949090 RepID=A0ABY6GG23_9BURK|nr:MULTISPECIES: hypothetical protein [unclassified Acidovorax]MCD2513420.1 hypothetical protein [Acidovorax sp. D4N7]UYG53798.1 hypothetical protein M9799_17845 [Acidovorax sp. 5MLIR]